MRRLEDTSLKVAERRAVERLARTLGEEFGDELESVWLYGSRARGEPGRDGSDGDVLVVVRGAEGRRGRVHDLAWHAAEAEGFEPFMLSVHVRDPEWVAYRRSIEDFFYAEVDRDKVVLAGVP